MRQIELDIIVKDAQARTSAKELQRMYSEISRDASGNITQIVDKYSNALGNLETHILKVGRNGDTYIQKQVSDLSKATAIIEKQGVAWQNAYSKSEQLLSSFEKISKETSVFGELSENAFSSYSKGILTANEAIETTNNTLQYSSNYWQDYYNSLVGVGKQCGVTSKEVSVFGELSDSAFKKYSTGAMSANDANKELEKQAQNTTEKVDLLGNALKRLSQLLVSQVSRAFKDALSEMKAVDSELIVVKKVTDASEEDLENLKDRAYETAKQYGVTASDYLSSVAEFSRAGYKEQAADLAELAVKLQLVGDVSQEVANQFLIATDISFGFDGNIEKLSETIDKANEIDNKYATTIEKIASGMGIIAPVAAQMNTSLDKTMAAIGTITAVTQRSGTEAARALRAIFLNIVGDTKTEIEEGVTWTAGEIIGLRDLIKEYAPQIVEEAENMGRVIDPMEAIGALAQAYKDTLLTEAELTEKVSDIGGKLRSSQLLALIQNWDNVYTKILSDIEYATGSADKEAANFLSGWEARLKILKTTWTDFIQETIDTNLIKGFIDGITSIIDYFGDLESAIQIVLPLMAALYSTKLAGWFESGTKAISDFVKGLEKTSTSSISASTGISLISLAIAGVVAIYKAYRNSIQDTIKAQQESLNESQKTATARLKLYNTYKQSEKGSTDYLNASKELTEQLGNENNIAEALFGTYGQLSKQYEQMGDSFASFTRQSIAKAVSDANALVSSTGQDLMASTLGLSANALSATKLRFYEDGISGRVWKGVSENVASDITKMFDGTFRDGAEGIVEYYNTLLGAKERLEKEALDTGNNDILKTGFFSDTAYKRITSQISAIEDEVNAYEGARNALGKQLAMQDIFNNSTLQGIKTQEDFNNAVETASDSIIPGYAEGFKEIVSSVFPQFVEGTKEAEKYANELAEQNSLAFVGLKDEIEGATKALEKYKKTLEGGEKGDTLKQVADVYATAKENFENGYYGSTQYQAALDLLLPESVKQKLGYDYKAMGEYVFGEFSNGAYEALYGSGGDDYGAVFATYLRDNAEGMEDIYEVINDNGDAFDLLIHDEDKLAEKLGMTTEQIYEWMDALDIRHSDIMLSTKDVTKLIEKYGDLSRGVITDGAGMIRQLVKDGRTEGEIRNIIDQLDRAGQIDMGSLPEDLSSTIQLFKGLEEQEKNLPKEATIEVRTDPQSGFFDEVIAEIDTINKTKKIVIGVSYKVSDTTADGEEIQNNWQGVDSAKAGPSLINERGAELIVRRNKAFIVDNGNPTLFRLQTGDKIFNAKETAEILGGGGASVASAAGGIPVTYQDDNKDSSSNKSGGGGGGKKTSTKAVADSDLLSMLSDYIKDLLDKAKKALDVQIDTIDAQIEALKKEHDAEEEANELEELRLKILEAEKNLVDANVERTVRYFNKATGQWEWMADQKAVAEAQKALEDAQQAYYDKLAEMEYQAKLDELNAQKEALKENYNALSDNWNDIKDEISKALNKKDVLSLAEILTKLGLTAASGSVGGVNSLIASINAFTGSFDNGGFAFGKGFLLKGVSKGETVLDESITDRILSPKSNSQFTNFTNSLTKLFGMSSGDIGAKAQSLINSIDRSSNISGDTYYINGVRIGSDMMDRPLSEILSVLPIYAS